VYYLRKYKNRFSYWLFHSNSKHILVRVYEWIFKPKLKRKPKNMEIIDCRKWDNLELGDILIAKRSRGDWLEAMILEIGNSKQTFLISKDNEFDYAEGWHTLQDLKRWYHQVRRAKTGDTKELPSEVHCPTCHVEYKIKR